MIFTTLFALFLLQADTPYSLLRFDTSQAADRLKDAEIAVSVERPLARAAVEQLVCQVLGKQRPARDARLSILVFVDLDTFTPIPESDAQEEKFSRHQLARYVWNRTLPKVRGRLVIMQGVDGSPLDPWQSQEFNHEKVCKGS